MTKEDAIKILKYNSNVIHKTMTGETDTNEVEALDMAINALEHEPRWISVSERLPKDTEPVNITWVNHNPETYYADIKDKPFTATGHYCNGRWWWYSVTCQDYLDEYGRFEVDAMDDDIEVIAWMPLPKPYKAEKEDKECD